MMNDAYQDEAVDRSNPGSTPDNNNSSVLSNDRSIDNWVLKNDVADGKIMGSHQVSKDDIGIEGMMVSHNNIFIVVPCTIIFIVPTCLSYLMLSSFKISSHSFG